MRSIADSGHLALPPLRDRGAEQEGPPLNLRCFAVYVVFWSAAWCRSISRNGNLRDDSAESLVEPGELLQNFGVVYRSMPIWTGVSTKQLSNAADLNRVCKAGLENDLPSSLADIFSL